MNVKIAYTINKFKMRVTFTEFSGVIVKMIKKYTFTLNLHNCNISVILIAVIYGILYI